jgi:two-component system CAI-1 autoinducer sensor kinase/phosphatase CqsS
MLLLNAATTAPGSNLSPIWIYQYIVALFFFVQLIHHGPFAFVLWITVTTTLFGSLLMVPNPNITAIADAWIYPMPVYLTALIIGAFTNRNLHVVQAERLRAASAIGSNIAHELRTPLASIRSRARGIGKHLDDLVAGYEAAKASGLDVPNITPKRIFELEAGLSAIQDEVEYSNTIINMLLINTSDKPISEWDFDIFSAARCIEEAVSRYPFNNSAEKMLLSIQVDEDFSIRAPRLMVVHVLFNLIKNGLYSVQRSGKGTVVISLERSAGRNLIKVRDSGAGIPANVQGQIFERFFTTIHFGQGAGIGLSFCKMVMQGIEGEIQCESEEGEYTVFRLYFPDAGPSENSGSDSQQDESSR